jgi:uncharacterized protein YukE
MAGLIGADVEALERLAADFDHGAQELRDLASQLAGSIEAARDWTGPDAERCKNEWGTFAQQQMTGVSDALATAGRLLAQNAREQEDASRADDVGPGTGYGLMPFIDDLKALKSFFWGPISALLKAKSLVDFLKVLQAARLGTVGADAVRTALGLFTGLGKTGALSLLSKISLPTTIFSGVMDVFTGGDREGWRGWATRGFGLAGAAGAGALLASSAGLVALGPVGLGIAAVAVTGYGLWSAGNFVYDHWDSIRDTGSRVLTTIGDTAGRAWEGISNGYESAMGWARGLLGGGPRTAGAGA